MSVGVAIPSIPSRKKQLARTLSSVVSQTRYPDQISVAVDTKRQGAAPTRNRAWQALETDWVAFIDDDDEFYSQHLEKCLKHAHETGADLVFPWFDLYKMGELNGKDPLGAKGIADEDIPGRLERANFIPVTVVVKREMLAEVGGFPIPLSEEWPMRDCEDWGCWKRIIKAGGKISHLDEVTWKWHHWGYGKKGVPGNTSGMPDRW